MIADTDFFIDLMRTRSPTHDRALTNLMEIEERGGPIAMTAITRFELSSGVEEASAPATERSRVAALLAAYATFPLEGAGGGPPGRHPGPPAASRPRDRLC